MALVDDDLSRDSLSPVQHQGEPSIPSMVLFKRRTALQAVSEQDLWIDEELSNFTSILATHRGDTVSHLFKT